MQCKTPGCMNEAVAGMEYCEEHVGKKALINKLVMLRNDQQELERENTKLKKETEGLWQRLETERAKWVLVPPDVKEEVLKGLINEQIADDPNFARMSGVANRPVTILSSVPEELGEVQKRPDFPIKPKEG